MASRRWRGLVCQLARRHRVERYAEIGVDRGKLAGFMEREKFIKEMILVDPWRLANYNFEMCREIGDSQEALDKYHCDVSRFAARSKKRIQVLRMTSEEAARVVRDRSLDMVFIDAIHEYKDLKQDIALWTPKLVSGGILSGDDYTKYYPGVKKAVDELWGVYHYGWGGHPQRIWAKRVWHSTEVRDG